MQQWIRSDIPGSAIRLRYRAYVSQDRRSSPRRTWHSEGNTPPAANSSLLQLPYQRQKRVAHSALRHWPYAFVANHALLIDHTCFRHAIATVVRSEARREWKACVSTWRSWGSTYIRKKQ